MTTWKRSISRRSALKLGAFVAASSLASPSILRAQAGPIRIGHITTLSGRSAVLGISSQRGLQMEIDAFNSAGGLDGRLIELVQRDSKGAPDQAASLTRELIASEGCPIVMDCDSSGSAFAIHEVFRSEPGVLGMHCVSETSQLTADPKLQIPNAFRVSRQGIHDSISGAEFAAKICKERGLKRWATVSADYSYGRQTTPEFLDLLKAAGAEVEVVGQTWPKLSQPDYTENITAILNARPEVIFLTLFGGDLTAFIDQASIFGLFENTVVFSNFIADYTTVSVVKSVPKEIYGPNRYSPEYPATAANKDWFDAYQAKYKDFPTNWSWEAVVGMRALVQSMKATGSAKPEKLIPALADMEIDAPFGAAGGHAIMRGSDRTLTRYALGWGRASGEAPYLTEIVDADWGHIEAEEAKWKAANGY